MGSEGGAGKFSEKIRENNEKTEDIHRKSIESVPEDEIMVKLVPKLLNFTVSW